MGRLRADQAHHDQSGDSERQCTYIELARISKSSNQLFSAAETASGLMQMAIVPEAAARAYGGAQQRAAAHRAGDVNVRVGFSGTGCGGTDHTLAIMDVPSMRPLVDELIELNKNIET